MSLFPCDLIEAGKPLPGYVDFYKKRAAGVGLIVVSGPSLDTDTPSPKRINLSLGKEAFVDLLDAVREHDSKILVQLSHSGKFKTSGAIASDPKSKEPGLKPKEQSILLSDITLEELKAIEQRFIEQAENARSAGFDGVEIQAGYGHLIEALLSPLTNKRTDEYGGSLAGRSKLLLNVLLGIRKTVAGGAGKVSQPEKRFLIQLKLCVDEFEPHGLRFPDIKKLVMGLPVDLVDIILITAGSGRTKEMAIPTTYLPDAYLKPFAAHLKKVTKIPIAIGGKIRTPATMRQILDDGTADLIALSRPLFADPELPLKMMIRAEHDIRPCIACDQCTTKSKEYRGRRCSVNPTAFMEAEEVAGTHTSKHADDQIAGDGPASKKPSGRVAVIGGGPAGMQAAIMLAHRGYDVVIFEKNSYLGGKFEFACRDDNKREYRSFLNYLTQTVLNARVDIRSDTEVADITDIQEFDEVIIATGANHSTVKIDGARDGRTLTIDQYYEKYLTDKSILELGDVLIVGAQRSGAEIADQILSAYEKAGILGEHSVTLTDRSNEALKNMNKISRKVLLSRLKKRNADLLLSTEVIRFEGDEVVLRNKTSDIDRSTSEHGSTSADAGMVEYSETNISADTVIIAAGVKSENALFEKLSQEINDQPVTAIKQPPKLYLTGDAAEPGDLGHALRSAYLTALRLTTEQSNGSL